MFKNVLHKHAMYTPQKNPTHLLCVPPFTLIYVVIGVLSNLEMQYVYGIASSSVLPDHSAHLQAVLAQLASQICKINQFLTTKDNNQME